MIASTAWLAQCWSTGFKAWFLSLARKLGKKTVIFAFESWGMEFRYCHLFIRIYNDFPLNMIITVKA